MRSTDISSRFSARETCCGNWSLLLAVNKMRVSSLNEYIFSNLADTNMMMSVFRNIPVANIINMFCFCQILTLNIYECDIIYSFGSFLSVTFELRVIVVDGVLSRRSFRPTVTKRRRLQRL